MKDAINVLRYIRRLQDFNFTVQTMAESFMKRTNMYKILVSKWLFKNVLFGFKI
jgi:hypothetical protein